MQLQEASVEKEKFEKENDIEELNNIEDIDTDLSNAFDRLKEELPFIEIPQVYAQIGSFDQSIIVGNNMLGISLDKYLGADYPFYLEHYSEDQRSLMTRSMVVPDCLGFYILSLFPIAAKEFTPLERDTHMGKIQWVVNKVMGKQVFDNAGVSKIENYMNNNKGVSVEQLLRQVLYSDIR